MAAFVNQANHPATCFVHIRQIAGLGHGPEQWRIDLSAASFQGEDFEGGLNLAIDEVSALLTHHCPPKSEHSQPNELPDEPVLG